MLLPVGLLAVPAAVLDEAEAGAARQGGLVALAVGAGAGVVAGGGLLLGWHGFGRRGERKGRGAWETPATPKLLLFFSEDAMPPCCFTCVTRGGGSVR